MEKEIETPPTTPVETEIMIIVDSIENFERINSFINIIIEHNDIILGISPSIKIDHDVNDEPCLINYRVNLPVSLDNWEVIHNIISIPILVKVIHSLPEDEDSWETNLISTELQEEEKIKPEIKMKSRRDEFIIGISNLDIFPIFLGETTMKEKLIIEAPVLSRNSTAIPWTKLPLLSVTVNHIGPNLFATEADINFLNITIESIYNPPLYFTKTFEYECGTVIYIDSDLAETTIFGGGKWTNFHDTENRKKWKTLGNLESRAKFSKYKISSDYENVHNELKSSLNLKEIMDFDAPRIEWNFVNRNLIRSPGVEIMQQQIEKYKCWPFQIFMHEKNSRTENRKSKEMIKSRLYQCYIDLTELLYPGRTRVRAVTQLYMHNTSEMIQNTGLDIDIFKIEKQKETKNNEKRDQNNSMSNLSNILHSDSSSCSDTSTPLVNEADVPVVILIEFELKQPFKKSRPTEEYSNEIMNLTNRTKPSSPYILTSSLAEEQFSDCIRKLAKIITERYQNFIEKNDKMKINHKPVTGKFGRLRDVATDKDISLCQSEDFACFYDYIHDEFQCFQQYLHSAGKYVDIRNTLKSKIINLLDTKFTTEMYSWDTEKSQNYVATIYTYLVESVHRTLNSTIDNQFVTETPESENLETSYYYAEEAYNLGNVEEARNYYKNIISKNSKNPDAWLSYTIFLLKISDPERAIHTCREAINLDSRHKIALLTYGILLITMHKYEDAQLFLEALISFYPRFIEGWVILNLFYHQIEYHPGLELTISSAEKCLKDKIRDTNALPSFLDKPLDWLMHNNSTNNIYILTASLLLKLNLHEFAEMVLAKELTLNGRSVPFLYYLSVSHYIQGKYENAIIYLKELESNYGLDFLISSLIGHCLYKSGKFDDALKYYEYANVTFNRPEDIHLVHLLMGSCYLHREDYVSSKKMFLNSCKTSPTCETWLGLGIALFEINDLKEAEVSFSEANKLNSNNATAWGYLCLLNILFQRYDEFSMCYRQTVKHNLKNTKLWQTILNAMEKEGYSSPIIATDSEEKIISREFTTS